MKSRIDPRHEARRLALSTLFEQSFNRESLAEAIGHVTPEVNTPGVPFDQPLLNQITGGVAENLTTINQIICTAAPEWPMDQIARIDLVALRIAVFELYFSKNVPPKVAIDEAIELAKEFGGDNSGKFVNGVLGTVVKTLTPEGRI